MSEEWRADAKCLGMDPEFFYPDDSSPGYDPNAHAQEAKQFCEDCPVRLECLQYALDNREQFGVWGGHTRGERRRILRKQRAAQEK